MAYKEDKLVCDVMRMNIFCKNGYEEFEGINVIEGQADRLANILDMGSIDTVCVHFLDKNMWNVLKCYREKIRIIVWLHGAEIQPWWRREYNYTTEEELNRAKEETEERQAFWKSIFEEIDKYFKENNTNKNGIWINIPDRQKVLNFINNYNGLNGKYEIDKEGFLYIVDNNNFTDTDRKIEKVINGDKQYVVSIKSYCYMVDTVTGEIVKNPYSDLEEYQTYEYFQDLNKFIIFVSENEDGKLTNEEIFYSLLKLME